MSYNYLRTHSYTIGITSVIILLLIYSHLKTKILINVKQNGNNVEFEGFSNQVKKIVGKDDSIDNRENGGENDDEVNDDKNDIDRTSDIIYNIRYYNTEYGNAYDDNYLNTMNAQNLISRECSSMKQCRAKYSKSLLEINNSEAEGINILLNMIVRKLKSEGKEGNLLLRLSIIKLLVSGNVFIAKGNKWLENGMPHTILNNIVLPAETWFNQISLLSKRCNGKQDCFHESILLNEGSTLIHELTHIRQRYHESQLIYDTNHVNPYNNLYKLWGFIKSDYIDNIQDILEKNRHNPDGLDDKWIWKTNANNVDKYYWIGAIFNNHNPSSLRDVQYIAVELFKISSQELHLTNDDIPKGAIELPIEISNGNNANNTNNIFKRLESSSIIQLSSLREFNDYFGNVLGNNNYHPNEISAQYMEIYYKNKLNLGGKPNNEGYKHFVENINGLLVY